MSTAPNSSSPRSHISHPLACAHKNLRPGIARHPDLIYTSTKGKTDSSTTMARTESIEIFSGYRPEGKKRSLTEAYYVPPFGYSSGLKICEFSKRRRTVRAS